MRVTPEIVRRAGELTGSIDELAARCLELVRTPGLLTAQEHLDLKAHQYRLAVEFGQRHGWRLTQRSFSLDCLARRGHHDGRAYFRGDTTTLDHPFFYRADHHSTAIVAHPYKLSETTHQFHPGTWENNRKTVLAMAEHHNLTASFPSDFPSWWYPGVSTLVVYQPTG